MEMVAAVAEMILSYWGQSPFLRCASTPLSLPPLGPLQKATAEAKWTKAAASQNKKMKSGKGGNHGDLDKVETFAKERNRAEDELHHLKEVDGDSYRPHDLRAVHPGDAGSEFSTQWSKGARLWTALHNISFFRDYRIRKAFTRVLEEVKGTHLLPQKESETYTLSEFQNALTALKQECVQTMTTFFQRHSVILSAVKEHSYQAHQELQMCKEHSKMSLGRHTPLHVCLARQQELEKELCRAGNILWKLGDFAALLNQLIMQSLVTLVHQDVSSFLHTVLKMCEGCGFFLEEGRDVSTSELAEDLHPPATGEAKGDDEMSGHRRPFCSQKLSGESARGPVLSGPVLWGPGLPSLAVQGHRVGGSFYPLCKKQLQQHMSTSEVSKRAEREQEEIMQEAQSEIQRLCDGHAWLVDLHLFTRQWSLACLESRRGQPASLYEELITNVQHWTQRIHATPPSFSTSNKLFIIHCSRIRENLEQRLSAIEAEVRGRLVEQMTLHSGSLISDLRRAAVELKKEPHGLRDFSKYAAMVRTSEKLLADAQQRLEYVQSLRHVLSRHHGGKTTELQRTLDEKMLCLWDCYVPLLKRAESAVCQRRPPLAHALETMFSFLLCDLNQIVSDASSGAFLDPDQNATDMLSQLNTMCRHVYTLNGKIQELSWTSEDLRARPLDLTSLPAAVQKVEARKELWELRSVYTRWIHNWEELVFSEVAVPQAQVELHKWQQQACSLTDTIPACDPVLHQTLQILERFSCQLAVMAKLQSSSLKHKHWRSISHGMGLPFVSDMKLTVAELMSQQLGNHQKLINKICGNAKAEWDLEQTFQRFQQEWEARLFQLDEFIVPIWQHEPPHVTTHAEKSTGGATSTPQTDSQRSHDAATFTVIGLEMHLADIEDGSMTLSKMLNSQHSVEFRPQVEHWVQRFQELEKLLVIFGRYQQTWAFLSKMLYETTVGAERVNLLQQFQPLDETFREMMHFIWSDAHLLNFVHFKKTHSGHHGDDLCQALISDLTTMEVISHHVVNTLHQHFPRLCFLSDREVIELLCTQPKPSRLLPVVRKLFKGVRWLEVVSKVQIDTSGDTSESPDGHMKVVGVFGDLQEHVAFLTPLDPNLNPLVWFHDLERQLRMTMVRLTEQCVVTRNQLEQVTQDLNVGDVVLPNASQRKTIWPVLDLLSEYPLQCVLVAEEVLWCSAVVEAYREANPALLSDMKTRNSAKVKSLSHFIRGGITSQSVVSNYKMMCVRALVHLTMTHTQQLARLSDVQCELESSFEWLSLMKYGMDSDIQTLKHRDPSTCHVDVLGSRLKYGYEYSSTEDGVMVSTPSTDRAILGILLALTSYRCAFVRGPCMSGKSTAAVHLGRALGRQVVLLQCCPGLRRGVIQQMLFGALQTGAWLLLDSVDPLTHGVLSSLGEHLIDIHQYFRRNKEEKPNSRTTVVEPHFQLVLGGKRISADPGYGCVLISSKMHATEIPESLRAATRPVALTPPDYRIIAEVMLASMGFSEAASLSRRLVSIIRLAKDSLCLSDLISKDRGCYLVVLQKIITSSLIHLEQSIRQRETSHEVTKKDVNSAKSSTFMHSSQFSPIIWGLMEETAIVKSLLSVLVPFILEEEKASQFHMIFKDAFPIVCQFPFFQRYLEEEEEKLLKVAVTEELATKGFHADTQMICSALTLFQAIKFSQAVVLIGPSGSGKTTCYCALAGALSSLADKAVEGVCDNDNMTKGDTTQAETEIYVPTWSAADTVVLFPDAMSPEELFGFFCEDRQWQDGAIAKVLRDPKCFDFTSPETCNSKRKSDQKPTVKWLVMDGEPVGQPGWLDYLTTLCRPEDPYLCLSSGEKLMPSRSRLKLLVEVTDLSDASPSAVTRCSLVHFTGKDLWKAVWKREVDALRSEHSLDQRSVNMWMRLAEDLFSSTLSLAQQRTKGEGQSPQNPVYGLREIMSCGRILHALLQHYGKGGITDDERDLPPPGSHTADTELQDRNMFLVAYIWGFGGHLHPRSWPQFDSLARQLMFDSRFRIEVPEDDTVFEHFFVTNGTTLPRSKNTQLAIPTIPKYGKYAFLLDIMLEANQPVLLAGEPGSGKTTLCKTMVSVNRSHVHLSASAPLSSRDLRSVLYTISSQRTCAATKGSMIKPPGLLLFVDDLHEAPCDVLGKRSKALETLRQCLSTGGILTFDTSHFRFLSSRTISYMATCCVSGLGGHPSNTSISPRLSRLFSIFVLPSLSTEVILSVQSPLLKLWLQDIPFADVDMAHCIITSTKHLYDTICEHFQPTVQSSHFIFSHRDLWKVFQGMFLWQPDITNTQPIPKNSIHVTGSSSALPCVAPVLHGRGAELLNIVHLWMHECLRTFSDKMWSEDERKTLISIIANAARVNFDRILDDKLDPVSFYSPLTASCPDTCLQPTDPADRHEASDLCPDILNGEMNSPASPSHLSDKPLLLFTTFKGDEACLLSGRANISVCSSSASRARGNEDLLSDKSSPEREQNPSVQREVDSVVNNQINFQDSSLGKDPHQEPTSAGQANLTKSKAENQATQQGVLHTPPLATHLLHDAEEYMAKAIYGPELTEALKSLHRHSYQEQNLNMLVQQLSSVLDMKEEDKEEDVDDNYRITFRYMVHRQRARQLMRILRALLIPGGHGALISSVKGTGRKTTVRLAASLAGYHTIEVHAGNERKWHHILKQAGRQSRVDGVNVIILAHEDISQSVRQELLVSMDHGTYPAFYTDQDLKNLVSRVNVVKNSRRCLMDSQAFDEYSSHFHKNVHVFLLLPSTATETSEIPFHIPEQHNQPQRTEEAQTAKALSLSCCVEEYQPWSSQALVEVAAHGLKSCPYKAEREGLEASLSLAMAGIHQCACRYASAHLRATPFSPQTYAEFIAHFSYLCHLLHQQGLHQGSRLSTVLAHLDGVTHTVRQRKHDVVRLQEKLTDTQQREQELLRAAEHETSLLEERRQKCVIEENKLSRLEEQIHHARTQASPLFLSGLNILQYLNPSDLEEVRHYRNPPEGVVRIMDALCLLFSRRPGWESAKLLLGQANFFQELEFFDRNKLRDEHLQQLGQMLQSPHFVPESMREVSKACESLCRWVQAVHDCSCVQPRMVSQEDKQNLEVLAGKVRRQLNLASHQENQIRQRLQEIKLQLQSVRKDSEELREQLHKAESLEREAAAAARQIERHVAAWGDAAQEEELNNQALPGDALILAAIISYLGPFAPEIRTELLNKWTELCQTGSIDLNPQDPRASLSTDLDAAPHCIPPGFPISLSERLQSPLCRALGLTKPQVQDSLSARLLVKLMLWGYRRAWVGHWPLLADSQYHLETMPQTQFIRGGNVQADMEGEYGMLVRGDDPELSVKLHLAAEEGLRVLLTHVERATPSPQFVALLARHAGRGLSGSKQAVQPNHPKFCLFLSTQLPTRLLNSAIHPAILSAACVVDLSLSPGELQELMLTQLLQSETEKLVIQHTRLQNDKWLLQEKLVKEEVALMDYILQSDSPLLQDAHFLPRVAVCQEAMKKQQVEIQQYDEELEYQQSLLAGPREVVGLAAVLYQALQEVSRLSPAYFFCLRGFITAMDEALIVKGRPLVSYTSGKVPEGIITEIKHRMAAHLLVQYRPLLFKSHFTVLKLLVTVALLEHNQLCSEAERAALLRGLVDVQTSVTKDKSSVPGPTASLSATSQLSLPSWIPPHIHPELLCLEKIPAFTGLIASLTAYPKQWQEYLRFPSSTMVGPVPCYSHSHLSPLQRALLWKTMVPHCLEEVVEDMAACHLCLSEQTEGPEVPHTGNPQALSRYIVRHEGPIILTLPSPGSGRDKWTSIQPLHFIQQLAQFVEDTNEVKVKVKVISCRAQCDRAAVLSALDRAAHDGHWLVLNNRHRVDEWDGDVVVELDRFISSVK
ncbi:dynein heavy chain domain-containing protein 1, partial [Genypterus blacodes]|uniref:dynein heavy chain domain-containing protein 1 n=1 Tax=Genypterus blacodes TaxID=154954 RepID=UPI003F76DF7C